MPQPSHAPDLAALRIVFVSPRFHTNEAELLRQLALAGHTLTYVAHESRHSENHATVAPVVVGYRWSPRRPATDAQRLRWGLFPRAATRVIRSASPDVVVVKGYRVATLALSLGLRLRGIPVLVHVQRDFDRPDARLSRRVFHRAFGRHVVTPVRSLAGSPVTQRRVLGQHHYYAPFVAAPATGATRRDYLSGGVPRILIVGKFTPRKNLVEALEVIGRLAASGTTVEVTVVGTVLDPAYHRQVLEVARAQPGVTVLADVPHDEMVGLYAQHDVFVLPSVREAASYSHLEAMAQGLAVVVSTDNGAAHYVEDGVTGFLFDPADFAGSLEAKLGAVLADPELASVLGRRALDQVARHHTYAPFDAALRSASGRGS